MSEETKIQPGQWWEKPGTRVFVVGLSLDGRIVAEREYGTIALLARGELYQDGWKHLPDCTGWDWQPEVYPQYWTTPDLSTSPVAYVLRTAEDTFFHVYADGHHKGPYTWFVE